MIRTLGTYPNTHQTLHVVSLARWLLVWVAWTTDGRALGSAALRICAEAGDNDHVLCLCDYFIFVKRYNDQATIRKESNQGLAYSFRGLANGGEHGSMQADAGAVAESYILTHRQRDTLGLAWAFETSKTTTSGILPPTNRHFLILLILSHIATPWRLSICKPMGVIPIQNTTFHSWYP